MHGDVLMWKGDEQLLRCGSQVFHHIGEKYFYVCEFNVLAWGGYKADGWQANQDPNVWRRRI